MGFLAPYFGSSQKGERGRGGGEGGKQNVTVYLVFVS